MTGRMQETMQTVFTLVRLRWALTFAAMRKSVWQTVGYIICWVLAAGMIIGAGIAGIALGEGPALLSQGALGIPEMQMRMLMFLLVFRCVMVIGGACAALFVILVQVMYIGEGSTMSPGKFALYGIADRTLSLGLLASGLAGIPSIAATLALIAFAPAYRWLGAGAVVTAIIAAPLAIVTLVSLSKLVIALSTTLVTSQRGKNAFYIIVIVVFIIICQMPNIMVNGTGFAVDPVAADAVAGVLAFTPLGAAFQLPFDVLYGNWSGLVIRLAILALTWWLCLLGSTWCLKHERLTIGATHVSTGKTKGIGVFAHMPDSVSGAISGRIIAYLRHDPRQSVMMLMPLLFVFVFALQQHGITAVLWQSLLWGGVFMMFCESNGLAYDGRGFAMEVLAGVRGKDDRLGRVRVQGVFATVYLLVLALVILVVTGDWRSPGTLSMAVAFTAAGLGCAYVGLGLSEVLSVVLMYPVPAIDRPFSNPQGGAVAQGFFPLAYMFGSILLMLPTGIVAGILTVTGAPAAGWIIAIVALANGIGGLALGIWLGGKLLDARMVSIVATLESFASLQK